MREDNVLAVLDRPLNAKEFTEAASYLAAIGFAINGDYAAAAPCAVFGYGVRQAKNGSRDTHRVSDEQYGEFR